MDYQFPAKPAVSASCKDLLARILVADPVERLSIQQIYQQPWFKQGFPKQVQCLSYPSYLTSTRKACVSTSIVSLQASQRHSLH